MDRSLDEIINERPRGGGRPRGPRGGRGDRGDRSDRGENARRGAPRDYESAPRDGVKKYSTRDSQNINRDWVHDKYDDDHDSRRQGGRDRYDDRHDGYGSGSAQDGSRESEARVRVENLHYDIGESDLKELFARLGPISTVRMLYDRNDRSTGTAFVTYQSMRDARDAIREFDGANAYGQPIRVELAPATDRGRPARNPFDYAEKPGRSLFDRIESGGEGHRRDNRARRRSNSPGRLAPPGVDRFVPGRESRSPIPRRGTPRESGRRPGARREDSGRPTRGGGERGGRGRRTDGEGRPLVGGRPKKTAEELDAEMNDYWGSGTANSGTAEAAEGEKREPQVETVKNGQNQMSGTTAPINDADDIDLMVE